MSVTRASGRRAGEAAPPEPRSRLRRLVDLYTGPGDRTPTSVGVGIALLAAAGLLVLGPTSQLWLLACTALLAYAVAAVVRPVEAWCVLRRPAAPPAGQEKAPDPSGWLPTRELGRR